MTIAIITEQGVRKVAPLVLDAKAQADRAAQAASVALAGNTFYATQGDGEAATNTGEYFWVVSSGSFGLYLRSGGGSSQVGGLPFYDAATGRLGIGTITPARPLHINAADQSLSRMRIQNTSGQAYDLVAGQHDASQDAFSLYDATNDATLLVADVGRLRPGSDNAYALGFSAFRFSVVYAGTGSINTSDENDKTDIGAIPDEWLDAWADVEWSRFKFIGGTRWHTGLVAQQVHAAFAAHDIDAFEIGLCCFDQWEASGDAPAGSRWGLRYDECQAMEAAYQRRRMDRLEAQVAAL